MHTADAGGPDHSALVVAAVTATRRPNPYPRYRQIRKAGTFIEGEIAGRPITLVTRHAEASALLADPAVGHGYTDNITYRDGVTDGIGSLLRADPPDHTRLRRLVGRAFTPAVIDALAPAITALADELLDVAVEQGEVDAVQALARPLPLLTINRLLGVPASDEKLFGGWADALTRGLDPEYLLSDEEKAACRHASAEFDGYFRDLIAQRRREPREDLLSRLVAIHDQGDALSERELTELCTLLLIGGYETTMNTISGGILALARNPEQLAALRADPGLIGSAVEEMLRYDPPVQFIGRTVLADTGIGERRFARGDGLIMLVGAANRDPDVFDEPDRFLVDRYAGAARARRHLGFAAGIHYCLGAPLARLEAGIAFRALLSRASSFEVLPGPVVYREQIIVRGLRRLPLRLHA